MNDREEEIVSIAMALVEIWSVLLESSLFLSFHQLLGIFSEGPCPFQRPLKTFLPAGGGARSTGLPPSCSSPSSHQSQAVLAKQNPSRYFLVRNWVSCEFLGFKFFALPFA